MAIQRLMLVKASGKIEELDGFIEACRKSGEFHPENTCSHLSGSMGFTCLKEENPYTATIQKIEEIAAVSGFELNANITDGDSTDEIDTADYIRIVEDKLHNLYSDLKMLEEQLNECEAGITQLTHFKGLDVPIEDTTSCEFLSVRYGYLPKEQMIKLKAYEDNPYVLFIPCSSDEHNYWGVYFAPKDKIKEVDRIFAFMFFERIRIPGVVGTPTEIVDELQENVDILKQQIEALNLQISAFWSENGNRCNDIYSRLKWLSDGFELRRFCAIKNEQFFYIIWIFKSNTDRFKESMNTLKSVTYEISDNDESNRITPPVKLKNNRLFRIFESFVSMYGLPSYKAVDVTAFVAVTYTVIFGIMFGDVGHGIVLITVGLLAWKLKGSPFGKLFIPLGFSSIAFGLIFGSFFGYEHLLDPVYRAVGLDGKPLEVMHSIDTVLTVAIGIGIVLMIISMMLNVYSCIRRKAYGEALFSHNGFTGIMVYVSGVVAVYSFMSGSPLLPGSVVITVICIGIPLLLVKDLLIGIIDGHINWKPKSVGEFLMQSIFEVIEHILSYFSNTMSFLRVGAFVLVHAGMMMVVFSLAGENENIIIIALGNLIVIALEGLIAGIQALRLEFYELFSHFFEGDGRPFVTAEQAVADRA